MAESTSLISSLQSMRDRLMPILRDKFGDAFDGDMDTLLDAINHLKRTPPPQAAGGEPVDSDGPCSDEDGCPTEGAVLKRFWRAAMALANGWQDEAAATWGESTEHATLQRCCDELRLAAAPAQPAGGGAG
jgi:hypothetical protein